MSQHPYPALEQFLGAHFHQDWSIEAPDSSTVVARYLKTASPATVQKVVSELRALRAEDTSEGAMEKRLTRWGCYYHPTAPHTTYADWLHALQEALACGSQRAKS